MSKYARPRKALLKMIIIFMFSLLCLIPLHKAQEATEKRQLMKFLPGHERYPKQDLPSTIRIIFISGMLGSGHEQFVQMWESCENCVVNLKLSHLVSQLFNEVTSIEKFAEIQKQVLQKMIFLREKYEGQDISIILNAAESTPSMSFPISLDEEDYPKHPDLIRLADLALKASLDLRLIVLMRDASHVIKELIGDENNNVKYGYTAREFVDLCEVQVMQLVDLDPNFYVCWDHEDPTNDSSLKSIGKHINYRTIDEKDFHDVGKAVFSNVVPSITLTEAQEAMLDFYRLCIDNLRELCSIKAS
mmetsp:Transcript_37497/g.47809  ORF Transcript_37497/g.47809 Transcript_37497/m.47809 type:complete len:303 (+) Transcript_37497:133-1041(+)